jgi:CBS domain-containing protein
MRDLTDFTVAPTDTIRTAMERIDRNRHRVVVVIDEGKVVGTVSDGDIRRAFLHDTLQIAPVNRIMQLNPHVATVGEDANELIAQMRRDLVTLLPIVDAENALVDVALAYEPYGENPELPE